MARQQVARLQGPRDIVAHDADIPVPGPNDVVVRVAACGICGTDLAFYRHGSAPAGAVLGHEFAGRISAVGERVAGAAPGQRVTANPMLDGMGLGQVPGAFAQYVRVPGAEIGRNLFLLPDSLSDEAGTLVEPFAVGLHAVTNAAVSAGDRAVVFGAGTIGLCVLAALRARGVHEILVVDPSEHRLAVARRMGATATHMPADGSATAFVGDHYGSESVRYAREPLALATVAFDCAGAVPAMRDALHSLSPGGRLVLVADPHDHALPDLRLVMLRELKVVGALAYDAEFAEAIDLLASGRADLSPLVTHRFPLSEVDAAFDMQLDPAKAVKVLVLAD